MGIKFFIIFKLKIKLCEDVGNFIDLLNKGYYYDYIELSNILLVIIHRILRIFSNDINIIYQNDIKHFDFLEIQRISNNDLNNFKTKLIEGIIDNVNDLELNFDNNLQLINGIFNF